MAVAVCSECGEVNPPNARFCVACGAAVPLRRAAEERKVITVVFIDLVGSAATDSQDPEDIAARLLPYYERLRIELERHGGTVERFFGDAIVAIFGVPIIHEDDPERAVRAALAAFETLRELNAADTWADLKIRVAVNTGEGLVAVGARPEAGETVAFGSVMNTAERLQAAAPVNGILVGELTYRATSGVFEYRDAGAIPIKGRSDPVSAWEVIGFRRSTRAAGRPGGLFVGRDDDLRELVDQWEMTRSRKRPALAVVVGSPGLGKTRLLSEFAFRVDGDCAVLRGRCLPYGEGITYWPVAEIVESAAGILKSDADPAVSAKLTALVERLDTADSSEAQMIAAAAADVIGARGVSGRPTADHLLQSELHWALRRLLLLVAFERPLVVQVEDLHWAEPTLLELLQYFVTADEQAALLVVGTARPDLLEWAESLFDSCERVIRLHELADDASRALLADLGGPMIASGADADRILEVAAGNPLFIEEIVRVVQERRPEWDVTTTMDSSLAVPVNLQALIASRLDQLPFKAKSVAELAAVVGEVFWPGALCHLFDEAGAADIVDEGLVTLVQRDIVRRNSASTIADEREYAFKHVLLRDVAYARLPKSRRVELHRRFAAWARMLPGDEDVEIVAWHLERACLFAKDVKRIATSPPIGEAITALSRAAEKAKRREGHREAESFLKRALALVDESDPAALEIRVAHVNALLGLGKVEEALQTALSARAEAVSRGRLDLAVEASMGLCAIAHRQGLSDEARERVAELDAVAAECQDRRLQLRATLVSASLKGDMEGALAEARDELEDAAAIAEEIQDTPLVVEAYLRMGFHSTNMGELSRAEAELERCSCLAAEMGNRRDEARANCALGIIRYLRGDGEEGERLAIETMALLERTGETFFQVQNLAALAECNLARGDTATAERYLREALGIALREASVFTAEVCRLLVETLVRSGRIDEASEMSIWATQYSRAPQMIST
jgi:class 3 adenylate cyclase/tetratricopeptide (TPR) repeat protein